MSRGCVLAILALGWSGCGGNLESDGDAKFPAATVRLSLNSEARQVDNHVDTTQSGDSIGFSVSEDGTLVAFDSVARLTSDDYDSASDVFLLNRGTGVLERVSMGSGTAPSDQPAISLDGRYVAYRARTDGDVKYEIHIRDRQRALTSMFVLNGGPEFSWYDPPDDNFMDVRDPSLSSDGRYLAFVGYRAYAYWDDPNTQRHIYALDTVTGVRTLVSRASGANGAAGNGRSSNPVISADGRSVAFDSYASNLVAGDTNAKTDVFVRDRLAGRTVRVSIHSTGTEGNEDSSTARISANGRYVVFVSLASNLSPDDTNGGEDLFSHGPLD